MPRERGFNGPDLCGAEQLRLGTCCAKQSVWLGSSLAGLGHKVNLITFKGLKHQLSPLQFDELIAFYREVIPERLEIESIPRPVVLSVANEATEGCKAGRMPGLAP